jgi:hypothetical protein
MFTMEPKASPTKRSPVSRGDDHDRDRSTVEGTLKVGNVPEGCSRAGGR